MLREGLTVIMEYRDKPDGDPYAIRTEFPLHTIEMANKDFMYMLGENTKHMWHKMEKELFDRD